MSYLFIIIVLVIELSGVFSLHLYSNNHLDATAVIPNITLTPSPFPASNSPLKRIHSSTSQLQIIQSIYSALLTDKSVKKLLDNNDTDSSLFKTLLFTKVRQSIRSNLTTLQSLSQRAFDSSNLSLSSPQKQQLLQAFLNNKQLTDLFAQGKQDSEQGKKEIIKKIADMYKNNPVLMGDVAEKVFEREDSGELKKLGKEEKSQLFGVLLGREECVTKDKLEEKDVEKVVEEVGKNQRLKELMKRQGIKESLKKFLRNI